MSLFASVCGMVRVRVCPNCHQNDRQDHRRSKVTGSTEPDGDLSAVARFQSCIATKRLFMDRICLVVFEFGRQIFAFILLLVFWYRTAALFVLSST